MLSRLLFIFFRATVSASNIGYTKPKERSQGKGGDLRSKYNLTLTVVRKQYNERGLFGQGLPNSLGYFILLRACARRLYHITPAYFASTWLGDCMSKHVMMWSLDCRWYTASCLLPSSKLYIRMCR